MIEFTYRGDILKFSKDDKNKINQFLQSTTRDYYIDISNTSIVFGDWLYCGVIDTGYMGGGICERGHLLRYEHIIENIKTGERKVLGVNCVEHYFDDTNKDKVKAFKKVFRKYRNSKKDFEEAIYKMKKYFGDFNNYLANCYHIYALRNYENNFPKDLILKADSILKAELLLPESIVKLIIKKTDKNFSYSDFMKLNEINKTKIKIDLLIKTKGLNEDEEKFILDIFFIIYRKDAPLSWTMDYINSLFFRFYKFTDL